MKRGLTPFLLLLLLAVVLSSCGDRRNIAMTEFERKEYRRMASPP
jgi:hypothetical protein